MKLEEEVLSILKSMANTLNGLTVMASSHEKRILTLEGKPIPPEVEQAHLNSFLRAIEAWGDDFDPNGNNTPEGVV